jgi:hypothetical protein
VTTAVERQDLGFVFQSRDNAIPDAAIERKGVNQRNPLHTWVWRGMMCERKHLYWYVFPTLQLGAVVAPIGLAVAELS